MAPGRVGDMVTCTGGVATAGVEEGTAADGGAVVNAGGEDCPDEDAVDVVGDGDVGSVVVDGEAVVEAGGEDCIEGDRGDVVGDGDGEGAVANG